MRLIFHLILPYRTMWTVFQRKKKRTVPGKKRQFKENKFSFDLKNWVTHRRKLSSYKNEAITGCTVEL